MRIIGGAQRGTKLAELGRSDAQAHLRPTSDKVRESIFNLLMNARYGQPIKDARVLDLFAGTGALGLEALSRGAKMAVFIDTGALAGAIIRDNVAKCHHENAAQQRALDCTKLPAHNGAPFDVVFCDPPYGKALGQKSLQCALAQGWLAQHALIVLEDSIQTPPPHGFIAYDSRRYGATWVHIWGIAGANKITLDTQVD